MLFGFVLIFAVSEGVLRLMGYSGEIFQRDAKTGLMTIVPGWQGDWKKECFDNKVKINSSGFNAPEFNKQKDGNVYRIAVVGDSFVEALQVPQDKTFYHLLEEKLNEEYKSTGKKFEVMGFGHSGNGTFLNTLYMKKYALSYRPDLIVNAFLIWNDFKDDNYALSKSGGLIVPKFFPEFKANGDVNLDKAQAYLQNKTDSGVKVLLKQWASKSAFIMWLYPKYYLAKSRVMAGKTGSAITSTTTTTTEAPLDYQQYLAQYPPQWDEVWKEEESLLKAENQEAAKGGAKFLLMSLVENYRVYPQLLANEDFIKKFSFDFDKPERYLQDISSRQQFPYLALLPAFRARAASTSQEFAFPCDGHWNETGHAWAADAMFDYLKNNPNLLGLSTVTSSVTSTLR